MPQEIASLYSFQILSTGAPEKKRCSMAEFQTKKRRHFWKVIFHSSAAHLKDFVSERNFQRGQTNILKYQFRSVYEIQNHFKSSFEYMKHTMLFY